MSIVSMYQLMQVRWGNSISAPFPVMNGVRQGGVLSHAMFNVYKDDLSKELNACKTGGMIGFVSYQPFNVCR